MTFVSSPRTSEPKTKKNKKVAIFHRSPLHRPRFLAASDLLNTTKSIGEPLLHIKPCFVHTSNNISVLPPPPRLPYLKKNNDFSARPCSTHAYMTVPHG